MIKNKRIEYIDVAKFLGIVLVIIGHINFLPIDKKYIYSFHMPLFFMLYGFVYIKKNNFDLKTFLLNKVLKIYVPYLLWAIIYSELNAKNILYILYGSHLSLKIASNSSLWFLPTYFFAIIIYEIINYFFNFIKSKYKRTINDIYIYILIAIICLIISMLIPNKFELGVPFGLNVSFMAVFFIIIGNFSRIFVNKISTILHNVILLLILFGLSFLYKYNDVSYVLMAENRYGFLSFFIFSAIVGSLMIIVLSKILTKFCNSKFKEIMIYIGQNTLFIFAFQKVALGLIEKVFSFISMFLQIPMILWIVIIVFSVLIISYYVLKLVNILLPQLNGNFLYMERIK